MQCLWPPRGQPTPRNRGRDRQAERSALPRLRDRARRPMLHAASLLRDQRRQLLRRRLNRLRIGVHLTGARGRERRLSAGGRRLQQLGNQGELADGRGREHGVGVGGGVLCAACRRPPPQMHPIFGTLDSSDVPYLGLCGAVDRSRLSFKESVASDVAPADIDTVSFDDERRFDIPGRRLETRTPTRSNSTRRTKVADWMWDEPSRAAGYASPPPPSHTLHGTRPDLCSCTRTQDRQLPRRPPHHQQRVPQAVVQLEAPAPP